MEKKDTMLKRFARGALAILLALISIAVVLPNLWHPASDASIAPPGVLVRSFHDEVVVCVIPIIPLVCIFAGMFRRPFLEYIGWALLIVLFVVSLRG